MEPIHTIINSSVYNKTVFNDPILLGDLLSSYCSSIDTWLLYSVMLILTAVLVKIVVIPLQRKAIKELSEVEVPSYVETGIELQETVMDMILLLTTVTLVTMFFYARNVPFFVYIWCGVIALLIACCWYLKIYLRRYKKEKELKEPAQKNNFKETYFKDKNRYK